MSHLQLLIMRNTLLLLLLSTPLFLNAQQLAVRTVTVFKNGKAMVERSGRVPIENRRYTTRTLPPALFGTYWASSASGELTSVFTSKDSLETAVPKTLPIDLLEKNKNQTVRIWLNSVNNQPSEIQEGKFIRRLPNNTKYGNVDNFLSR